MKRKVPLVTLLTLMLTTTTFIIQRAYAQPATMSVEPSLSIYEVDQNFTICIWIDEVWGLHSWEAKIRYDESKLTITNVTEGSFLGENGAPTFFTYSQWPYYVQVCGLITVYDWVDGEGIVANVTFKVSDTGRSDLDLYDTSMFDVDGNSIEHTAVGGVYYTSHPHAEFRTRPSHESRLIFANETVTFNATAYVEGGMYRGSHDPDGNITEYLWDFGDPEYPPTGGNQSVVYHAYTKLGAYTVNLTVSDDKGLTDSDVKLIVVRTHGVYISVPYHGQITSYYCGPAALEMVFDFYGADIPQAEIADVARTAPPPYGTYTCDMVRAAHFSNLSTSVGGEMQGNITGYTARKLGYAAFEYGGMTIDELKSLITAGYPIIVLTTWHFRVAVGYDSSDITFQDSYYGKMFNMTYEAFDTDWDYSNHWALFVSPWKVEVSVPKNVSLGSVFNVTASVTYPSPSPFPTDPFPASIVNATVTLPDGLTLVAGDTAKKTIDADGFTAGASANVTWTVQADSLGNFTISVEAEGKVTGFAPSLPSYPEPYTYEDKIGGLGESVVTVISLDDTPPTTIDDYDGLWHTTDFTITLNATDDASGVAETYYRINDEPTNKSIVTDGQPLITTEAANNTLEYWSVDKAYNEESHHVLTGIKLDKTAPSIGIPSRTPEGDILPDQRVEVSVNVTDTTSGVKNVTLSYTTDDGATWTDLPMNYNSSTKLYETTILDPPPGTLVKYKIVAYDNALNQTVNDNAGQYYVYSVVPEFPSTAILPLLMIFTILTIVFTKRRFPRKIQYNSKSSSLSISSTFPSFMLSKKSLNRNNQHGTALDFISII